MPNPSVVRREKGLVISTLHQLLLIDIFRYIVAYVRFFYFVKIKRSLKTYDLGSQQISSIAPSTVMHNLKGLKDLAVNRSLSLVRPLSVIESLDVDSKILTIGPRTEGEILNLMAYGFKASNITGLDLITYSPWIKLGDMHKMPFGDNSFDAIILGWVLAYSKTPRVAALEIVRVAKAGAVVAIGVEYNPMSVHEIEKQTGYIPGHDKMIQSCSEILSYFGENVDHVYYNHNVIEERRNQPGAFCVIFSLLK